jgi:dolichol kinase
MQASFRSAFPSTEAQKRPGRGVLARKLVHAALSLLAAGVVWLLPYPLGAVILAAATAVALTIEVARRVHGRLGHRFLTLLGPMLRENEAAGLTGATTLAVGYTMAAVLFAGWPAVAGILVVGLADPAAAMVGARFGRLRYPGGKSVEGSLAFLAVAIVVLLTVPGLSPLRALGTGMVLAMIEAPSLRMDDNLYLPLITAAAVALTMGVLPLGGFS